MEKKKTIAHFLAAIAFVVFAIALFKISSGEATTDRFPNPDGSYDYSSVLKLFIPFNICIVMLAAIITALQDGEFGAWLGAFGAITLIAVVGCFLDLMSIAAVLVGGVYVIWWGIVAVKSLAAHWNSFYWENKLLAIVRTLVAATLVMFVIVWLMLPLEFDVVQDMTQVMPICGWAGGLAIATAVGLVVEGALWIKYCSY